MPFIDPTVTARLDSLTGLRFFAAFVVFGIHATAVVGLPDDLYNPFRAGTVGVSFFFLLSGFLLAWSHRPGGTARDFWQRRFARVYPAFGAAWSTAAVINLARGDGFGWHDALALTLTQAWVPDDAVYFAVSAVFWSLSAEAFFYAILPVVIRPLGRLSERGRLWTMGVLVAAIVGVATMVHLTGATAFGTWVQYIFPPVRALEFVLGAVLALQYRHGRLPVVPLSVATSLAVLAFLLAGVVPGAFMPISVTLVPFCLVIVAAVQTDVQGGRSWLRSRPMVRLGEWSYAFYLVHLTALGTCHAVLERAGVLAWGLPGDMITVALAFLVTLVGSAVLFRAVERPLNKRLRPRTDRVTPGASPGQGQTAQLQKQSEPGSLTARID